MTAPTSYPLVTTLLARKILETENAIYDPPVGLDLAARLELNRETVQLWNMAEGVGLLDAVRRRIALVGRALLNNEGA